MYGNDKGWQQGDIDLKKEVKKKSKKGKKATKIS